MAEERRKKKSNITVWAVLALLVLALGGFGATSFGGGVSNVASVGDREITMREYGNALRNEQARLQEQTGQQLTLQQMRTFGLDQQVMERLLAGAALEGEAARVGLSVGDAEVARRIRETPAFGGVSGGFDRQTYTQVLGNAGLDEATYEARVRDEAARELLQAAIVGGVDVPDGYVDRVAAWIAETRDITLAAVTPADLPGGTVAPTDAQIQSYYDENQAAFETPERRAITYAWINPDDLAAGIDVDEATLRDYYEERASEFRQPERVLAERLAFADTEAAQAAHEAIAAGDTTFDALVEDRGLSLEEVDQGEIARGDVDAPVADALFALNEPGIAGPVDTPLGPALYRVNAILDATETPFEDVRADLRREFALDAARRRIDAAREEIADLLAGGATLEEIADQTDMVLGQIEWDAGMSDGIAAYQTFRDVAAEVQPGDFPDLGDLSDGGIFALRVDEILPPAVPPLGDIRADVEAAWQAADTRRRLSERAEALAANPAADIAGTPREVTGLARDANLQDAPGTVLDRAFEASPGDIFAVPGDDRRAFVVRLDAVHDADLSEGRGAELRDAVSSRTRADLASDVFEDYGRAVQNRLGFDVNQGAVEAVQSQLGGGS